MRLDPFSSEDRAGVLEVLALTTLRPGYEPERDEAANYLPAAGTTYLPSIYQAGDSTWLGEFLQAFGGVLRALDLRRGARVLEYGAGEGLIAVQLARLGCDVTVVDIERRYLDIVRAEAASLHTSVATLHGQFGDGPDGTTFDAILFFEAFHHALDHVGLLARLRDRLAPNGRVVFAGEPIIEPGGYWAPTLPYAWGPRLDALSLRAMRAHGWCELGYSRDYFIEALMRAGFVVRFRPCADTARGAAYIAQAHNGVVEIGEPILIGRVRAERRMARARGEASLDGCRGGGAAARPDIRLDGDFDTPGQLAAHGQAGLGHRRPRIANGGDTVRSSCRGDTDAARCPAAPAAAMRVDPARHVRTIRRCARLRRGGAARQLSFRNGLTGPV